MVLRGDWCVWCTERTMGETFQDTSHIVDDSLEHEQTVVLVLEAETQRQWFVA